jgi:hypothetical protein
MPLVRLGGLAKALQPGESFEGGGGAEVGMILARFRPSAFCRAWT